MNIHLHYDIIRKVFFKFWVVAPILLNVGYQCSPLGDTLTLQSHFFVLVPDFKVGDLTLKRVFGRLMQAKVTAKVRFARGVVFYWREKFGVRVVSSDDETLVPQHSFALAHERG